MQIERNIKTTFRWWNNEVDEISFDHQEALDNSARERIFEMNKEGYMSGELNETVDKVEYRGWWEVNYV